MLDAHVAQWRALLASWLETRLTPEAWSWAEERSAVITAGDERSLYLAFGLASRRVGKADLQLSNAERHLAEKLRPGLDASAWTVDQAVRIWFVLNFPHDDADRFVRVLDRLFGTAEVHELIALYQSLPILPHAARMTPRAAEGLRTNIPAVFCAVAHHNPFPSEQFSDDQWNQMILKCQFIGVSLQPVVGLATRHNAELSRMLVDFAHERWAAGRTVSPEMWQCVAPFADERGRAAMQRVLDTGTPEDQAAVREALEASVGESVLDRPSIPS